MVPGRQNTDSKNPTDPSKKTSSWAVLGSEHSDSSPASQLVTLIEHIRHVEAELEQTIFFRQMKYLGKAQVQWIITGQFVRIVKATSQAAAIKEVSINRRVLVGIRSAGGNGVALIMVQEDPVVLDEGEFLRGKKELTRGNLRSRSAFEAKIGVGIESAQCTI